jgi:hypothetical protein
MILDGKGYGVKIAIITANLGKFDPIVSPVKQKVSEDIEYKIFNINDTNFLPRTKSMTSRLQARIPKMFGWQFAPDYDYYIWVDASFTISHKYFITHMLDKCNGYDIALFKHPDRNTITEEANFIKKRINEGCKYLISRYENELVDEQLEACLSDKEFKDDQLFATCSFIYKNNDNVKNLLEKWWVHTSRYHVVDQLSIPYLAKKSSCKVNIIRDNIYKIPYLTYIRNRK